MTNNQQTLIKIAKLIEQEKKNFDELVNEYKKIKQNPTNQNMLKLQDINIKIAKITEKITKLNKKLSELQ